MKRLFFVVWHPELFAPSRLIRYSVGAMVDSPRSMEEVHLLPLEGGRKEYCINRTSHTTHMPQFPRARGYRYIELAIARKYF
jgi:hypothetical protein